MATLALRPVCALCFTASGCTPAEKTCHLRFPACVPALHQTQYSSSFPPKISATLRRSARMRSCSRRTFLLPGVCSLNHFPILLPVPFVGGTAVALGVIWKSRYLTATIAVALCYFAAFAVEAKAATTAVAIAGALASLAASEKEVQIVALSVAYVAIVLLRKCLRYWAATVSSLSLHRSGSVTSLCLSRAASFKSVPENSLCSRRNRHGRFFWQA